MLLDVFNREALRDLLSALTSPGFSRYLVLRRENLRDRLEQEEDPHLRGQLKELKNFAALKEDVRKQIQKVSKEDLTNKEE